VTLHQERPPGSLGRGGIHHSLVKILYDRTFSPDLSYLPPPSVVFSEEKSESHSLTLPGEIRFRDFFLTPGLLPHQSRPFVSTIPLCCFALRLPLLHPRAHHLRPCPPQAPPPLPPLPGLFWPRLPPKPPPVPHQVDGKRNLRRISLADHFAASRIATL